MGCHDQRRKTLVSAGLASSFLLSSPTNKKFIYLKPLQTPPLPSSLVASNHVVKASILAANSVETGESGELESGFRDLGWYEERRLQKEEAGAVSVLICKTMYGWREAISAHLAAEREGAVVEDSGVLEMLKRGLGIGEGGGGCEL